MTIDSSADGNGNPTSYLSSVSCPSASFCVAVDAGGNALTFNGSSWSAPAKIDARRISTSSVGVVPVGVVLRRG